MSRGRVGEGGVRGFLLFSWVIIGRLFIYLGFLSFGRGYNIICLRGF